MSSGHGWCNVAAFPEAERAHAGAAMETCHTADGINLATLAVAEMRMPAPGRNYVPGVHAGLLEDVQGYEAAIPVRTDCKALLRPQCLQVLLN